MTLYCSNTLALQLCSPAPLHTFLKDFLSLHFFTIWISCGVKCYFPRLWGTGISDAILNVLGALSC